MGRKGKYEDKVKPRFEEIKEMKRLNWSEQEIAKALGIAMSSFTLYKTQHEEFREVLKQGEASGVETCHRSLQKLIEGYNAEETEYNWIINKDGDKVITSGKTKIKHIPANLGAIHLYLKNHDDNWHEDDAITRKLKQDKLELERLKAEEQW